MSDFVEFSAYICYFYKWVLLFYYQVFVHRVCAAIKTFGGVIIL
jgi:hypothetical protein